MADINSNLKLYYNADSNANDSSPSGLTGTFNGSYATGKVGFSCFDCSGGKYVAVGTSNTLNITGSTLSIAAWIKPTTVGNYYRIVERGGTYPSLQYSLIIDGATGKLRYDTDLSSGVVTALSSAALTANVWTHVAMVYNGSTIKLYINGTENQSLTYTGNITSYSGAACYIGRYTGGSGYEFPGQIDEVRIYDRALSAGDVSAMYAFPAPARRLRLLLGAA